MNKIMFDKSALDEGALEAMSGLSVGGKALVTVELIVNENSEEQIDAGIENIVDVSVAPDSFSEGSEDETSSDDGSDEELPASIAVLAPGKPNESKSKDRGNSRTS